MPVMPDSVRRIVDVWAAATEPAVIFDFNGTLSDDEPVLYRIFTELFAEHLNWSMTADDYNRHLLGHSDREIIEKAIEITGAAGVDVDPLLERRKLRYREMVAHDNPIRPETVELVRVLAGHDVPLAIVTGAQRDDVAAVLGSSPVGEWITVVVAEEDVGRGKPDPEGFLAGAARLGCAPQSTLVFEDSLPGVRGAQAAGMHCIAVCSRPGAELVSAAPGFVDRLSADVVSHVLPLLASRLL